MVLYYKVYYITILSTETRKNEEVSVKYQERVLYTCMVMMQAASLVCITDVKCKLFSGVSGV